MNSDNSINTANERVIDLLRKLQGNSQESISAIKHELVSMGPIAHVSVKEALHAEHELYSEALNTLAEEILPNYQSVIEDYFLEYLRDPDPYISGLALESIAEIGRDAAHLLIDMLGSVHPIDQQLAVTTLSEMGDSVHEPILQLLGHPSQTIQQNARAVLLKTKISKRKLVELSHRGNQYFKQNIRQLISAL